MKRLVAGMKKEFVNEFIEWMKEHGVRVSEPYEFHGIWNVMYMPIGKEQKQQCEQYIEYRCNNDLM
jgi:hypothetical protein